MATFLKLHSVTSTNRALRSGLQNASNLSQSSENLPNDLSIHCPPLKVHNRVSSSNSPNLDTRSQSCKSERFTNDVDFVLPQELYQKLYVTQPNSKTGVSNSRGISCPFVLLDCRSTKAFRQKHIDGALNVNCSNRLYCRRLRDGKMSIADLITSEEGKVVLKQPSEKTREIIVYDEDTQGTDNLPTTHPVLLVLSRLRKDGSRASLLKGGIQAFEQRYSDMCNTDDQNANHTSMSPLVMTINTQSGSLDSPGVENRPPRSATIDAPMARILPYLYVGGERDAADASELKLHGINYILNVTNKIPCFHEGNTNFTYLRIPVRDNGSENLLLYFDKAFQFIEQARQRNGRVLIHCQAGISRSSTVAIGYIMKYLNLSMNQAYNKVQACRPIIAPNISFVGQLANYEKMLKANNIQQRKLDTVSGGCGLQASNSRPSTPITEIDMVET